MAADKKLLIGLIVGLLSVGLSGCGLTGNLRGNPGYAAFDSPGWSDTDREIAVSLGPLPLKLARALVHEDDPETAALLRGLKAVRVYVYRIDGDPRRVRRRMTDTLNRLDRKGWHSLVAFNEDRDRVRVMVRSDREDRIRGLVVMSQDESELVLVNLIGDLRPAMFNQYLDSLDIDGPRISLESG